MVRKEVRRWKNPFWPRVRKNIAQNAAGSSAVPSSARCSARLPPMVSRGAPGRSAIAAPAVQQPI